MKAKLVVVDFAELELRAQAMLEDQKDVHTETAAKMFGVPESEVTPTMRQKASNVTSLRCTNRCRLLGVRNDH